MAALLVEDVRFAFQPLVNIKTGGIVAIEALPGGSAPDLIREAKRQRRLRELDLWLAVSALRAAAEAETRLPMHINLLASTIAHDRNGINWLYTSVADLGYRAQDVTIEVGPRPSRASSPIWCGASSGCARTVSISRWRTWVMPRSR